MSNSMKTCNSDFEKCRKCMYFPDVSVDTHPYYLDKDGVKHRDIKYICQYDMHEITTTSTQCTRVDYGAATEI